MYIYIYIYSLQLFYLSICALYIKYTNKMWGACCFVGDSQITRAWNN